jgi:hypothetical protein
VETFSSPHLCGVPKRAVLRLTLFSGGDSFPWAVYFAQRSAKAEVTGSGAARVAATRRAGRKTLSRWFAPCPTEPRRLFAPAIEPIQELGPAEGQGWIEIKELLDTRRCLCVLGDVNCPLFGFQCCCRSLSSCYAPLRIDSSVYGTAPAGISKVGSHFSIICFFRW